jgi:cyclopropane-fatty-acyl-phospholipid synthase
MWDYYLSTAEAAFRYEDLVVFQIQITKRNDILPVTRDYLYSESKSDLERPIERKADNILVR